MARLRRRTSERRRRNLCAPTEAILATKLQLEQYFFARFQTYMLY